MAHPFLQTGTVLAAAAEWKCGTNEAQGLLDSWVHLLWHLPAGTQAHTTKAFPPPLWHSTLPRSLQAGVTLIRWRENGRPAPFVPLVQGQAILHTEGIRAAKWGAIVPDTAGRSVTAAAPHHVQAPPACRSLLRTVPALAPCHALTRKVRRATLDHVKDWMTAPGTRCPPVPVRDRLTAPTPSVCHAQHRASTLVDQLTDEVLNLALELLRMLYPEARLPPAGTSNRLPPLGLQRRVQAVHAEFMVEGR